MRNCQNKIVYKLFSRKPINHDIITPVIRLTFEFFLTNSNYGLLLNSSLNRCQATGQVPCQNKLVQCLGPSVHLLLYPSKAYINTLHLLTTTSTNLVTNPQQHPRLATIFTNILCHHLQYFRLLILQLVICTFS